MVNHKRFVTKVVPTTANSKHGLVNIFELTKGTEISKVDAQKILDISKKTVEQFNDKFNWSKRSGVQSSGYDAPPSPDNVIPDAQSTGEGDTKTSESTMSFDDLDF